ncbi:hypothetical protein BH23BAC2_BH23BAC2_07030 [soil metagenome]
MALNRQLLYEKCLVKVNDQIEKYNEKLISLKESLDSIDRHNDYDEEGKLLGEYEQITTYLDGAQKRKKLLSTIDRTHYTETVQFGSLVETKNNFYFIAAALGEVGMEDGSTIYTISTEAPIYQKLEGKKKGDTFMMKDEEVEILDVR